MLYHKADNTISTTGQHLTSWYKVELGFLVLQKYGWGVTIAIASVYSIASPSSLTVVNI